MARRVLAVEVFPQAEREPKKRATFGRALSFLVLLLAAACGGSPTEESNAPAQQTNAPAAQPSAPAQQPDPSAAQPSAPADKFDAVAPAVPFIDQNHPAGADFSYDGSEFCGPAIVAGIAKARNTTFGLQDAQLVAFLASIAGTDPAQGTTGNGMIFVLKSLGMQTDANPGGDLDWIDNELSKGHDVIAEGDWYAVPGREKPGFHSGHYIAVTAVSGGWLKYSVTDPWDGNVTSLTDAQLETFITSNPKGGFTISAW